MSRIKLLKQVVDDLKNLSSSLEDLVQAMEGESITTEVKIENNVSTKAEELESDDKKQIKLEDVRAILAEKTRLGFTKEIKQIILDLDATKLSEVKPQDYPTILEKVEGLGNE